MSRLSVGSIDLSKIKFFRSHVPRPSKRLRVLRSCGGGVVTGSRLGAEPPPALPFIPRLRRAWMWTNQNGQCNAPRFTSHRRLEGSAPNTLIVDVPTISNVEPPTMSNGATGATYNAERPNVMRNCLQ